MYYMHIYIINMPEISIKTQILKQTRSLYCPSRSSRRLSAIFPNPIATKWNEPRNDLNEMTWALLKDFKRASQPSKPPVKKLKDFTPHQVCACTSVCT